MQPHREIEAGPPAPALGCTASAPDQGCPSRAGAGRTYGRPWLVGGGAAWSCRASGLPRPLGHATRGASPPRPKPEPVHHTHDHHRCRSLNDQLKCVE
ncbi:hypothetical protein ACFPM0_18865 [Pseudonocardia sulfidoxydans]|uniref:hypothetical protein n=1 Tax=Pseudonocardia sulfidoxydans TaxID=54011 RepID=UPI003622E271